MLRGRDIKRYHAEWNKLWLINTIPSLNINIDSYPVVKQYLLSFGKDRLEQAGRNLSDGTKSRKKTSHQWFELQDTCAYHALFDQEKIVYPDITASPNFALAKSGFYINQTAYLLNSGNKCLLGILNSKVTGFYVSRIAADLGGEARRYIKQFIEKLPIPNFENSEISIEIENKVNEVINTTPVYFSDELERKINNLVYKLYQLSEDEIQIIETP